MSKSRKEERQPVNVDDLMFGLKTQGERMAAYNNEMKRLKNEKRETMRDFAERIKGIESRMSDLSDEILEAAGAPTGDFFDKKG